MMQDDGHRRRLLLRRLWLRSPLLLRRLLAERLHARFNIAAVGVFFDPQGRVLLLRHVLRADSGWGLPGGFLQAGEEPESGLARELREETGLVCDVPQLLCAAPQPRGRAYELVYLADIPDPRPFHPNLEIFEGRWCRPSELPAGMPISQQGYVRAAVRRRPVVRQVGAPSVG